jgi:photosystem II stability/assembly factor-like uncharacterized protein
MAALAIAAAAGVGPASAADRNPMFGPPIQATARTDLVWQPLGPEGGEIQDLVVHPASPNIVYALPLSQGESRVFRSNDFGETWNMVGSVGPVLFTLATDPDDPDRVYAAGYDHFYQSDDGGQSWSSRPFGGSGCVIYDIHVEAGPSGSIYAVGAANASGYKMAVLRSGDGGQTWSVSTFVPESIFGFLQTVVTNPGDPDVVFAGGYYYLDGVIRPMLLKSDDGGASWSEAVNGITGTEVRQISVHPDSANVVCCAGTDGLFKSRDGGATWRRTQQGETYAVSIAPDNPYNVYAGAPLGVYRSMDGGEHWSLFRTEVLNDFIRHVAVDPLNSTRIIVGGQKGIYKSESGGILWNAAESGLFASRISHVCLAPSNPDVIYAAIESDAVYRSLNGGQSWTALTSFYGCSHVQAFAVDPSDPDVVHAFAGG